MPPIRRILMVIGQFAPVTGGAERQCLKLSSALRRRGHHVKVLTTWTVRDVPQRDEIDGIVVERVWYPQLRVRGRTIVSLGCLAWLTLAYRIRRDLPKFDVVHVHQALWPAFATALAGLRTRKPLICKIGNSGERFDLAVLRRQHLFGGLAVSLVTRSVFRFIWTSAAVLQDLRAARVAERKLLYIPNGVELRDQPSTGSDRCSPGATADPVTCLFVGSLTPKKNLGLLADALLQLPTECRERIRLTIVGDGPERSTLAGRFEGYGLRRFVQFAGLAARPDEYFAGSDVFVLPSLTEGLSNAALEAMSWGLPLILSNAGGNSDLVDTARTAAPAELPDRGVIVGSNGMLFAPGNAESLAAALAFMVDHSTTRRSMGRRSYELVAAKYSMDRIVRQYEELYDLCAVSGRQN